MQRATSVLVGMEFAKSHRMTTNTVPSSVPPPPRSGSKDFGSEIRRTAERVDREQRVEAERQDAAAALQRAAEEERTKSIRQKRILGVLVGALVLSSALHFVGFGDLRGGKPSAWTDGTLDDYLREQLFFEVESIEFFIADNGRAPRSLKEMEYPPSADLDYEWLGTDTYRITVTDSGKSLTYASHMDPLRVFGERIND